MGARETHNGGEGRGWRSGTRMLMLSAEEKEATEEEEEEGGECERWGTRERETGILRAAAEWRTLLWMRATSDNLKDYFSQDDFK